jgi:hypothetical protein
MLFWDVLVQDAILIQIMISRSRLLIGAPTRLDAHNTITKEENKVGGRSSPSSCLEVLALAYS